jgi:Ca2+-binding RTX toxin-like protein
VLSIAGAGGATGCYLVADEANPPLVQDSACIATGSGGRALLSTLGVTAGNDAVSLLRNVTAVATGASSEGIESNSTGSGGSVTVQGVNVIASGTSYDIRAAGAATGSAAIADFSYSSYDTQLELTNGLVTDPGSDSNLTAPALLANPAAGDVHQRPGSWTIDRGSRAISGDSVDIDAEPRYQGVAPDIGADEFTVLRRTPKCFGEKVTILAPTSGPVRGTTRRDVIVGTPGRDLILSEGGDDLVCSLGGRDMIRAGSGSDRVKAAGRSDELFGGGGRDRLLGGGGRDRLKGGAGKDQLAGQGGADRLAGGGGSDRCGGSTKDRVSSCE